MRDEQIKAYDLGNSDPPGENLFVRTIVPQALVAVSKARYEQTLCAENPNLKPKLDMLEREKTQQTPETLAKLWKVPVAEASEAAERIAEAGFFERRGSKETPVYWVPFLYRDALNLVQGTA